MFANIVSPIVWLGGMGLIFGGLLAYAAKKFEVAQDPKIIEVRAALPGANCGGCGYAGCDDLAAAVVRGEVKANVCPSMSLERLAVVSDILGTDAGNINRQKAVIMCGGVGEKSKRKFHYQGIRNCREAMIAMQETKCVNLVAWVMEPAKKPVCLTRFKSTMRQAAFMWMNQNAQGAALVKKFVRNKLSNACRLIRGYMYFAKATEKGKKREMFVPPPASVVDCV